MIPKTIHYCWFGGKEKPKLARQCIKSWKKHCPDYEIIEWNESNFDITAAPLYVRQAYEAKKWAFVTDYVRLYAMTKYGGIYMDTDVEVLKPLDPYLSNQAFSGFESDKNIPTGIMASEQNFKLFVDLLKYYDTASFYNDDGSLNMETNVVLITNACLKKGLVQNGTKQNIEGFVLYPKDYFCPFSIENQKLYKTKNSVCIHWFNGSWLPEGEKERFTKELKKTKKTKFKRRITDIFLSIRKKLATKIIGKNLYNKLKSLKDKKND